MWAGHFCRECVGNPIYASHAASRHLDRRRARLVTERRPVLIAVRNVSGRRRWSKLQEWLSADVSKRDVGA